MKHIVALLLIAALCSGLGAVNFRVAVGMDAFGKTTTYVKPIFVGFETQVGPTLSAQVTNKMWDVSYGLGVDYQLPKEFQEMPEGWSSDFNKHAYGLVYGILAYNIPIINKVSHDFIAQFGYSHPDFQFCPYNDNTSYSEEGGLFYGLGAGLNYQKLSLNVLYRVNNSKITEEHQNQGVVENRSKLSCQTRQWNMSVGYRFGKTE